MAQDRQSPDIIDFSKEATLMMRETWGACGEVSPDGKRICIIPIEDGAHAHEWDDPHYEALPYVNPIKELLRAGQIVGLDPREMMAAALEQLVEE